MNKREYLIVRMIEDYRLYYIKTTWVSMVLKVRCWYPVLGEFSAVASEIDPYAREVKDTGDHNYEHLTIRRSHNGPRWENFQPKVSGN